MALLAVLGVAALAMRLPELGEPANNYDEGVYLESLLLMARGYQPFGEIVVSQGPLHLDSQLPFFLLFGQTVAAGRAASVVYSLAALAGVWWIARQLGGRGAALAAVALLVVSPTYLRFSRQALADVPALAPVTLAIGAALAYRRDGRRLLLAVTAALLALGILMKPIVLPAVVPVALLVWRPSPAGWRDLGVLAGLAAAVAVVVLLVLGPGPVVEQVLGFREDARGAYGWSLAKNGEQLVDKLDQEQAGFYALGLAGLGLALLTPGSPLLSVANRAVPHWAVALWAVASLALLLVHSPLRYHHMVILLPPLAVLGGLAVAAVPDLLRPGPRPRVLLGGVALAAAILYVTGLPELARRDALLLGNVDAAGAGSHVVDDLISAAERIGRLTDRDDVILTDQPYLAFLADRRVPPELVDPSEARLRSGDLTDDEVLALAAAYNPRLVVLWNDKLGRLPRFMAWVNTEYRQDRRFGVDDEGRPRVIMRSRDR